MCKEPECSLWFYHKPGAVTIIPHLAKYIVGLTLAVNLERLSAQRAVNLECLSAPGVVNLERACVRRVWSTLSAQRVVDSNVSPRAIAKLASQHPLHPWTGANS